MIFQNLIFKKHLDKGEKVLYAVHKHPVEIFRPVLEVGFFGFLIPWGLFAIGFNTPLFFWGAVGWSVLAYLRFIHILTDWYSDVWLMTNQAVIVVEWRGIFHNQATRMGYEDIEGMGYEIAGFWSAVLGYGNMVIKVMSGSDYEMKHVANPKKAELAFARCQRKYIEHKEGQDTGHLKNLLSQMVARHVRGKH